MNLEVERVEQRSNHLLHRRAPAVDAGTRTLDDTIRGIVAGQGGGVLPAVGLAAPGEQRFDRLSGHLITHQKR